MKIWSILFLLSFSVLAGCTSGQKKSDPRRKPDKNEMADLNRYMVQKDKERILNYLERKNLKMSESPSGLWYLIKSEGNGRLFTDFDVIKTDYECSLLDGTVCYSSETTGPREIVLGRSPVEAGLDQGLRMLKPGGEAVFIIPPFLAWGLKGDGNKIPSRSILVYKVKIYHN